MAEDFGVEDRGSFYDAVGALRDVVQNHLLQLIGLFAVRAAHHCRRRRAARQTRRGVPGHPRRRPAALRARPIRRLPIGPGVQARIRRRRRSRRYVWRSTTGAGPGVPFFIRAGKALQMRVTEIRVIFKPPPRLPVTAHHASTPTSSFCGSTPTRAPTWSCTPRNPAPSQPAQLIFR